LTSSHLSNVFSIVNGLRYIYRVDSEHSDFFPYEIDPHVLFTFYAIEMRSGVRKVFVHDRCSYVYHVRIQNRSADQREVSASDKQHLLQLDTVAYVRRPITVDEHQIVVGDFELLSAYVYDSKQPIVFGNGFVNGFYDAVGERLVRDRIVVVHIFLIDGVRKRSNVYSRRDYYSSRTRCPNGSAHRVQNFIAQHYYNGLGKGTH